MYGSNCTQSLLAEQMIIIKKEKIVHGIKIVKNRDFSSRIKIVSNVRNNYDSFSKFAVIVVFWLCTFTVKIKYIVLLIQNNGQ